MYINWSATFLKPRREKCIRELRRLVGGRDSGDSYASSSAVARNWSHWSRLGYVDSASFLCCNCLESETACRWRIRSKCAHRLHDYRLVEFAMRVPERMKVRNMTTSGSPPSHA